MAARECASHEKAKISGYCGVCQRMLCEECKSVHDESHKLLGLQELGNGLLQFVSTVRVADFAGYRDKLTELSQEIGGVVQRLKGWFDGIERQLRDIVHRCVNDVMSEVTTNVTTKLSKRKKELDEAFGTIQQFLQLREDTLADIQQILAKNDFSSLFEKYKQLYFVTLRQPKLLASIPKGIPLWEQHLAKIRAITEDMLKENVSIALKQELFVPPIVYTIHESGTELLVHDIPNNRRQTLALTALTDRCVQNEVLLVKNSLYIAGGYSEESKSALQSVYEYDLTRGMTSKADMLKGRYGHRLTTAGDGSFIYALAGQVARNKMLKHCEKYDRLYDRWLELKPLYEAKSHISVCPFKFRFLYIFGGLKDEAALECSSVAEMLDTFVESEGWKIVKYENPGNRWGSIMGCAAIQLNRQMILLFGGKYRSGGKGTPPALSKQTFVYSVKDNTIKPLDDAPMLHEASFRQSTPVYFKDSLFAIDGELKDLHVFDTAKVKWVCAKRAEWDHN